MYKKNTSIKTIYIILNISIMFVLMGTSISYAANTLKEKKQEIQNQIKANEAKKQGVQVQVGKINDEIANINEELAEKQKQEESLNLEIDQLEDEIKIKEEEIEKLKKRQEEVTEIVKKRLRVIYMNGESESLKMILTSKNINDFFANYNMVKEIAKLDEKLISGVVNERQKISAYGEELSTKKKLIAEKKEKVKQAKQATEAVKEKRKQALDKLDEEQKKIVADIDKLREEQARVDREIAAEIRRAQIAYQRKIAEMNRKKQGQTSISAGEMAQSGKYYWPIDNRPIKIRARFGEGRAQGYPGAFHSGIDIQASAGTPFRSIDDGIVVIAKSLNYSYGKYVVVAHPGGIYSLYAHGSAIHVKPGDEVKRGQAVISVGSTGNSTGPHAHFEIRAGGSGYSSKVDPLRYFNIKYDYVG